MDKKKNLIIGGLLAAIVLLSVGYAALAQTLTINGTANIDATWNVKITGITEGTLVGATTQNIDYDTTSATFEVDLAYPGASATYEVNVANVGSIDAKLASIGGLDTANAAVPTQITYSVSGVAVGDKLAATTGTDTAIVTVTWVKSEENDDVIPETGKTATITLNYVQDTDAE